MSTEKTGLGNFLEKIGHFFEGLFDAAKRAYNKLSPEVQSAMKEASQILEIINSNTDQKSGAIISLIKAAFPSLDTDKLLAGLKEVSKGLNIAESIADDTLEGTIENLKLYLESLQGATWAGVSSLAAKLLAYVFAPSGTKWATFESLIEFVYQSYVKKD